MRQFLHDPDAHLDYEFDWSAWCAAHNSDTISNATVTAPAGTSISNVSFNSTTVTAWVWTTQPPGTRVDLVCRITTAGGRQDDRTIQLFVQER